MLYSRLPQISIPVFVGRFAKFDMENSTFSLQYLSVMNKFNFWHAILTILASGCASSPRMVSYSTSGSPVFLSSEPLLMIIAVDLRNSDTTYTGRLERGTILSDTKKYETKGPTAPSSFNKSALLCNSECYLIRN